MDPFLETLAWGGSILLAFCGAPQAIKSVIDGHSQGLSWLFLIIWGLGELLLCVYTAIQEQFHLCFNYSANLFFISVMVAYKIRPRKEKTCVGRNTSHRT